MRVVCAGDRFIRAAALAAAARDAIGADVETVELDSTWPDEPFGTVDGVREASGDADALADALADGTEDQVLLTHLAPVTARVLTAAPSLAAVGVTRGGPVNADLAAATEAGVPVIYLPGRNLGAVAEFTVGVMIALPRSIGRASRALADGTWDARYFRNDLTGPELRAATVGLIGFGAVGRRVAQLLRGFGARVLAHDPFADAAALADTGVEAVELADLLAASDIVSVHARLTDDTRHMVDAAVFAAMKPGAYFVNTARGELVDQGALLGALESGRLAGAALDVFDPEPPRADDPLLRRPDVIATPHLAGASKQVASESAKRVADEVAHFLETGEITNCANPGWREHRTARL
ncbi:2-hydroxyacid dehydrogenase [uncultured Jatrophihabitans sp.]|uniref:2-hydroxyacid dehydrogenase n=1 Tax=uncultured Jatrophihabitans sp. TaxID=1610747 RepID=UPI0035CC3595